MAMLNNQMVTIVYYSYSYIDGVTNQNRHRAGGGHIVVFQFELELRMTHSVIH